MTDSMIDFFMDEKFHQSLGDAARRDDSVRLVRPSLPRASLSALLRCDVLDIYAVDQR